MTSNELTYKITGCNSVTELIHKSIHAEKLLNRDPSTVALSECLAGFLVREVLDIKDEEFCEVDIWKKAIGSKVFGLDVLVVSNKGHKYIEVLEVMK